MRAVITYAATTFAVLWFTQLAAGQEFYSHFLDLIDTNDMRVLSIQSPLLVDTNNTAPKLTSTPLDLRKAKDNGEIGGVRLGMTMEGVVASWGKPHALYSRCWGGPRFLYSDSNVVFEQGSNAVKRIVLMEKFPSFANGLSPSSTIEDFVHVLGKPTARKDKADEAMCEVTYETRRATLRIKQAYRRLSSIELDRLSASPHSKP